MYVLATFGNRTTIETKMSRSFYRELKCNKRRCYVLFSVNAGVGDTISSVIRYVLYRAVIFYLFFFYRFARISLITINIILYYTHSINTCSLPVKT